MTNTIRERLKALMLRDKIVLELIQNRPEKVIDFEREIKTLNRLEIEGIEVEEQIEELLPLAWMEERIEEVERKLGIMPGTLDDFKKRMDLLIRE
jgi:hypothetical protein